MQISKELLKGSIRKLILSILSEGELYGYQISKEISRQSEDFLQFGEGSLYPALHALELDGFVKSKWVAQDKGPDRKYYHLTAKGQKELAREKEEWNAFSKAMNKVLKLAA